jgi:hypothetical protein
MAKPKNAEEYVELYHFRLLDDKGDMLPSQDIYEYMLGWDFEDETGKTAKERRLERMISTYKI